MIVSTDPAAWHRHANTVEADLSPGRPLAAETWVALLGARPFAEVAIGRGPRPAGLKPVDQAATTINQNLARLNDLLFGPASYAVVARRAE